MAARPEVSGKTPQTSDNKLRDLIGGGISAADVAYTIDSFCAAHHISKAFFHKLRGQGLGPRLTRIGSRVLITAEAAAAWRAAREAETIQESA
jgi:hypothetical protein